MAFLAILSPYSLFHLRWGSEAAYAGSASFYISMMIIRSKRLAISELEIRMSREWMPWMDRDSSKIPRTGYTNAFTSVPSVNFTII
jgi:hypothetical protein